MQIEVLFQNSDFLAVNKPAGISVHNNEDPQNLLIVLQQQLKILKLFPVHRLDKETSGVQVLALNEAAARSLATAFEEKTVKKIYVGVLRGQLKQREGVWNRPLTDKAEGRKNPEGMSRDRVPCETRLRVLKSTNYFSFCEFNLITGRQHQIRKHSAGANHAIVGDPRYGDKKYNEKIAQIYRTDRMFLHCQRLEILGQLIESPIPAEFENLFKPST